MRTKIFMGALVALLAVACAKEQLPEQKESTAEGLAVTASVEQPGDGTRTSLDGLSVKWSVGDRIYLTDGTNTAIYEATTSSSSTSFSYVSGSTTLEGDVYAYYPAESVTSFDNSTKAFTATIPAVQPYVAGSFADGVNPMTAKATVDDGSLVLSFKNVMSFVKLQIADSAAGKTLTSLSLTSPSADLCGTATVTVGDGGVATTAIASGEKTVKLSGMYAPLTTIATSLYIAVPTGDLGKLTITAKTDECDGSWSQDKTAASALTAGRSSINSYNPMSISDFGNRVKKLEGPANCYMIDATTQAHIEIPLSQAIAGWDAIKALEPDDTFDKTKITSGTRSIAVRWFDGASGTIEMTDIDDENMTLSLAATNGSNAVVDLKNGDEIVWSWHLWFTDYKPGVNQASTQNGQVHTYSGPAFQPGGLYYGKVMMDRNLGATATGVSGAISQPDTDAEAETYFGLYYQFGRKDPFATTGEIPVEKSQNKTYASAACEPSAFYACGETSWNITDDSLESPSDPWNSNSEKSAFDPCPAGWRVPNNGMDSEKNIWTGITNTTWSDAGVKSGMIWCGSWLPGAGLRHQSDGTIYSTAHGCYIWGSSPYKTIGGCGLYINVKNCYTVFNTKTIGRSRGFCVRCVKDW